jgi:hypothetical protein
MSNNEKYKFADFRIFQLSIFVFFFEEDGAGMKLEGGG